MTTTQKTLKKRKPRVKEMSITKRPHKSKTLPLPWMNPEINQFLHDFPWLLDKVMLVPLDNKNVNTFKSYYNRKSKRFVIPYPANNQSWIFHELGHIASLTDSSKLLEDNYGLPISSQYSNEAMRHELTVFFHEVNISEDYVKRASFKKITAHIQNQMNTSLKDGQGKKRLKSIISQFLVPVNNKAKSMKRVRFHLDRLSGL